MALGSTLFLLLAPGIVAGLIPWSITGWRLEPVSALIRGIGVLLLVGGAAFLLRPPP